MSRPFTAFVAATALVLSAFGAHGVSVWLRYIDALPHACASRLCWIINESAAARPFFTGALAVSLVTFELTCTRMSGLGRILYSGAVAFGFATWISIEWYFFR